MLLNISLATKIVKKNKPLRLLLLKMSTYRKHVNETKYMSILIKDDQLLEKYYEIWEKKLNTSSKKNLIVNQYIMKNT